MRKDIDKIEIKEPPIKELKKRHSCVKRSCATGCGCVVILVVIFLLLLKFVAIPRPKELKKLPETFPASIPVYDEDNVEYITFSSGKQKSRILEAATYIPKVVLVPIFIYAEDYAPEEIRLVLKDREEDSFWNKFFFLMRRPMVDQRDTFELKWLDLSAEPEFIKEYYETELHKSDYDTELTAESDSIKQISFEKNKIQGVLFIKDDPSKEGTDTTIMTITLPEKP